MLSKPASCEERQSPLIRLFTERSGLGITATPQRVITTLIDRVYSLGHWTKHVDPLQYFLDERNIKQIRLLSELSCDGFIEPAGSTFADGFNMGLKKRSLRTRMRFTMAHEICHTFFYELVPELKFVRHSPDEDEEHLCNFGAAALLLPATSLKNRAASLPLSLESLDSLAEDFAVSLPTMAIRLKTLDIWRCELSRWRRMLNGAFALDHFYGGKQVDWKWEDESILELAWNSNKPLVGRTFVSYQDRRGTRRYKPVGYQVRRSMDAVTALWANAILPKTPCRSQPLFTRIAIA